MLHRELLIGGVFIGGTCDQAIGKQVVTLPGTKTVLGTSAEAGWPEADAALDAATTAFESWKGEKPEVRASLLSSIAALVREREDELAELLTLEVAKPITLALGEVRRMAHTFELSAQAAAINRQENVDILYDSRASNFEASRRRMGIGPVFAIAPYNWPFNLAAHKIGPALAAGNTVLLKGSPLASLCSLTLARLIHEAGCPAGIVNALNCEAAIAERIAQDPRTKLVSFTGSPAVGWHLKELLPRKRVLLELGGDSTAIVTESANLGSAAKSLALSAYGYAGQVCISAQHALVHRSVYAEFSERIVAETKNCPTGDPRDHQTVCGPMISEQASEKVQSWIEEAIGQGSTILTGGTRNGALLVPTLVETSDMLERNRQAMHLTCDEVFGPVLNLAPYDDLDTAVQWINASQYGIHASVFSADEAQVRSCISQLDVAGIVVNEAPTVRFDKLPYGGVKSSGWGREGVEYTLDAMSEWQSVVRKV